MHLFKEKNNDSKHIPVLLILYKNCKRVCVYEREKQTSIERERGQRKTERDREGEVDIHRGVRERETDRQA